MGSEFGALALSTGNFGSASASAFQSLPASGTPLGLVTGKILAVSANGTLPFFPDTAATPNRVCLVSTASSPPSSPPLNINSATSAAFSRDGLKAFILGNGGNTLYVYSPLESLLPPISLPAPAPSIVFNSTGSFALLAGGSSPSTSLAIYNTCNNFPVTLTPSSGLPTPPEFLKMVPAGDVPLNSIFGGVPIPNLQPAGLYFFFGLDSTAIDIIATTSSLLQLPLLRVAFSLTTFFPATGAIETLIT